MHTIAKHNQNANYSHCCATQELISKKAAERDRRVGCSICIYMLAHVPVQIPVPEV